MKLFSPSIRHPKSTFWLGWGLLLMILWAPAFWLQYESAFSADWILLGILMILFNRPKSLIGRLAIQVPYLLLLFWQLYRLFTWSLYRVEPNFYHEWSLLLDVLPIFWSEISLGKFTAYLPSLLGALMGLSLLAWALRQMTRASAHSGSLNLMEKGGLALLGLCLLLSFSPIIPVQWNVIQAGKSTLQSMRLKEEVKDLAPPPFTQSWPDSLQFRPNIYLIFIESYGEVLARQPAFSADYNRKLAEIDGGLQQAGWLSLSTRSISPISGGRSWLAFTSFMTGKHLYAHPQYLHLLKEAPDYPHLVRFLDQQGYYTLRLNTLQSKTERINIPYALYDRFFEFDRWIKYPDLPYQGPAYGKFGKLPDQYALGYVRDSVIQDQEPFFLFFITLNSHSPWNEIPILTEHWTDLDQLPDTAVQAKQTSLVAGLATEKYWQAMDYQLSLMEKVILQQGDSNSLFIFIGDHQPPFLTDRDASFHTPVHLISQNSRLMDRFKARGFQPGLQIEADKPDFRHEDFYSLLLNALQ